MSIKIYSCFEEIQSAFVVNEEKLSQPFATALLCFLNAFDEESNTA